MLIYFFIAFLTLFFALQFKRYRKIHYLWIFLLLLSLGVFRDFNVGADNLVYSANYKVANMNPSSWSVYTEFETGFSWIMAFIKTYISNNYFFFMGFIFVIYMLGINYLIKKESYNPILSLYFLIVFLCYTNAFNLMRQSFCIGLFCFIFPLIKEKKNHIIYILLVITLTFYIHKTLIVMLIPLLFTNAMFKSILYNKKLISIILISSYFMIFFSNYLYSKIPILIIYLGFLGERYTGYLATSVDSEVTISKLSSILNLLICLLATWVYPKKQIEDKVQTFSYGCYILSILFANILGSLSELFLRVSLNFEIFRIIYFTYLWYNIPNSKQKKIFRISVCCYGTIIYANAILKNFGKIVPYIIRF